MIEIEFYPDWDRAKYDASDNAGKIEILKEILLSHRDQRSDLQSDIEDLEQEYCALEDEISAIQETVAALKISLGIQAVPGQLTLQDLNHETTI